MGVQGDNLCGRQYYFAASSQLMLPAIHSVSYLHLGKGLLIGTVFEQLLRIVNYTPSLNFVVSSEDVLICFMSCTFLQFVASIYEKCEISRMLKINEKPN